jgi:predicted dehydrogenase
MASTIDQEVVGYPSITLPFSIAASARAIPRLELVAGCDIDAGKRAAFAEKWGVAELYEEYGRMLAEARLDMVAICTRGVLHAEMAVAAADAGIPMIFCEKAIACSLREADAVREAVRRSGCAFNTGVLRRFDPRYHAARRLIEAGEIGKPQQVVHYAASNLLHGHIHSIDTILYLLGDPQILSVWGELRPRDLSLGSLRLDQDPRSVYQLDLEEGVEALTVPAGHWEFEVFGTDGVIRSGNNGCDWSLRKKQSLGERRFAMASVPFPEVTGRSATVQCLEDLVDAHEAGRPTLGHIEITHHATEACFAVAESHRLGGRRVALPLESRDTYIFHV